MAFGLYLANDGLDPGAGAGSRLIRCGFAVVPEPPTLALLGLGAALAIGCYWVRCSWGLASCGSAKEGAQKGA